MKVIIAKVDETLFSGDAVSLTVPGSEGEMTVLGEHEPLVTTLRPGVAIIRSTQEGSSEFAVREVAIPGGLLEVRRDGATIIL